MKEENREIHFNITGDFVTQTARSWFWEEGKSWEKVEELLFSCMAGTDQTKEEIEFYARNVIFGYAKFIGNTEDDSYGLVEDNTNLVEYYYKKANSKIASLEKEKEEIENKYIDLINHIRDEGYDFLLETEENNNLSSEETSLVDSFLEETRIEKEFTDNYGWLSPMGKFFPVEFGSHQVWAHNKLRQDGIIEKYAPFEEQDADILVERGWILLHSPSMGVAHVTCSETKPITKAQKNFLFDYYTDRGQEDLAIKYMGELQ